MTLVAPDRHARTHAALAPVLAERWSPRAFDADADVPDALLTAALEAARWAPSAMNAQPWRFVVARRGTPEFARVVDALRGGNADWARRAAVLIVNVAQLRDVEGAELPWARYDLGQAVAAFTVQAHHDGLHVHQMGGIDAGALRDSFGLGDDLDPVTVSAVGLLGDPDLLPERLRARETAPRVRRALAELVLPPR